MRRSGLAVGAELGSKIDGCRTRLDARCDQEPQWRFPLSAVSPHSLEPRMIALRQANEVRSARAKLKQELRQGKVRLAEILAARPDYLSSAEVGELLVEVPKIGPVKAARLLRTARVSQQKTVGGLSDRQRTCLIELLTR
jgi:S13-like protein